VGLDVNHSGTVELHPQTTAIALSESVPAADRVALGPTPRLDGAFFGGLLLIGGTEVDPVPLLDEPRVQVVDTSELVSQLSRSNLAEQRGWVGSIVCPHCDRHRLASGSGTQQTALVVMRDVRELGTVLSIWAHPDDEAYLCGGIMAMAAAAGSRVVCVTATRGELGVTDPMRWPPEQLPAIREAELAACLGVLGIKEHRWLGYPDGGCAEADNTAAAGHIAEIIREIAPDTILTFPADGQTGHPDHIAVHRWTVEAVRRTGIGTLHVVANTQDWLDDQLAQWIELGAIVGEPPTLWSGPLSIDVALTGDLLDLKYAALTAQASQTEAVRAVVGEKRYREIIGMERFAVFAPQITPAVPEVSQ
jgi:LmbE family N-acetylglucosaminyl deacetylase